MSSYNRRYAILQDKNLKSSEVESVKSVTTPPTVSGVNQSTKTEMYGEGSLEPSVKIDSSSGGDISITASGTVEATLSEDTSNQSAYVYKAGVSPRKTSGSGFIQTDGASNRSKFTYKRDLEPGSDNGYQMRTTPNYFNKVPFSLEYDFYDASNSKSQCYTRPSLLSLKNGNLLSVYLDSYCPPWMWTFKSSMLDNTLRATGSGGGTSWDVVYSDVTNNVVTFVLGQTNRIEIQVGRYFSADSGTSRPTYYEIVDVDLSLNQFTVNPKGSGPVDPAPGTTNSGIVFAINTFRNRPSDTPEGNIKVRLSLNEDRFWSTANASYPVQVGENSSLDVDATGLNYSGCTGVSMVQFPDTEEVLLIYCGYRGRAINSIDNSSFLCVDELTSSMDSYANFSSGLTTGSSVDRRSYFQLNKYDGFLAGEQDSDISGIDSYRIPLSLSAEVLPSGRIVAVVAMADKLYSLTSDDRGVTFSANEIMSLQFGSSIEFQQFSNVDTCITDSGRLVLLLTANSIGNRGMSSTQPDGLADLSESVVSIFVTDDGVSWSSEKRLGGGKNQIRFSEASSTTVNYPFGYRTHIDESVYCLSGSVCMTPEGYVLVSVCTLNIGGPGNPQGCHVMQRTLSVDEIAFGSTGQEIAPSLSSLIYSYGEPIQAAISRFGMALPYVGTRRDNTYEDLESMYDYLSVTYKAIENVDPTFSSTDRGYLGSAYFSGIRDPGSEALPQKLYGGGPILMQGPIDVATTLHRGEVVTISCESWERTPSDSPNSLTYVNARLIQKAAMTRGVYLIKSDGVQPLNVRLPTELRRFEACYGAYGKTVTNRFGVPGSQQEGQQDGQVFFDTSTGLQQNYVDASSGSHVDIFQDWTSISFSNTRYVTFSITGITPGSEAMRFELTSITTQNNPTRYRLNLTPYSPGATLANVYDSFPVTLEAVDGGISVGVKDNCQIFGSNCFQVSLLGAKNPIYWGWDHESTSSTYGSVSTDEDVSTTYAKKYELTASSSQDVTYDFNNDFLSTQHYGMFGFPNANGEALKTSGGLVYEEGKSALSFVQRAVVQIQYGGSRGDSSSNADASSMRCSVDISLKDTTTILPYLSMGLSISRDGGNVYFSLINPRWSGSSTVYPMISNSEIQFSDDGDGSDEDEKVPFYEIIWGLKPLGDNNSDGFTPFIFARQWDRYADPDMLNGFRGSVVQATTIFPKNQDRDGGTSIKEGIKFGIQDTSTGTSNATKCSFLAVQMSRSFLIFEPCFAEDYVNQVDFPIGMSSFIETLRIKNEPQFDFLRLYNGGQMSPMGPPSCRPSPQMIDNGIELSFRGRATGQTTFSYEGKSSFPVLAALESPVKDGWRSPVEELIFSVTSENTSSSFNNSKLPTYQIELKSDVGINPEAVSLFGLNTSSVRVDFSNSLTFGTYNTASQPDLTMLFCSPGDPSSLLFNYYNQDSSALDVLNTPPSGPSALDKYVVGTTPTGLWVGESGRYATWTFSGGTFSWVFSNPSRGDIVKNPASTSQWHLYVGSLSWLELVQPNMFYKPVYLQSFAKYSLLSPDEDNTESVISLSSAPPASPSIGDRYLVSNPSGSWAGSLADNVVEWGGSIWNVTPPYLGGLIVLESSGATLEYNGSNYLNVNKPSWRIETGSPNTVYFTGSRNDSPPFRPSQYKSQSNENFYLVVVDRRATLNDNGAINVLTETKIAESADMEFTYYFKILDNGSDYLTLDRSISSIFADTLSSAVASSKITPGSMAIISDRMASNTPDFYNMMGTGLGSGSNSRYKNIRITLCGGNHSDNYLKLGLMISGQRIDLSNPDFELGYSYNLEAGSSLFDSLSGRRKSRRNHKPRKSWDVSYAPRPSALSEITSGGSGTWVMNSYAQRGNVNDHVTNAAQNSARSKVSWQELVERVLSIGLNGPVLALGFDGNNMQTVSGTQHNMTPNGGNIKPALSDPHGLCPVRLVGYEGASNVAYMGSQAIANSQYGPGSDSGLPSEVKNQTECLPAAVMQIKGLKFSEEL